MVSSSTANKSYRIRLSLMADPENCYTELELPRDLKPPQKMTALLYARDHLREVAGLKEVALMFD